MKKNLFYFLIFIFCFSISVEAKKTKPTRYAQQMGNLSYQLRQKGVPSSWLQKNSGDPKFKIYYDVAEKFRNMAERKVGTRQKDFKWYKQHFDLDAKAENGKVFIKNYYYVLDKAEKKRGIDYELIVAILGMESNFADERYKGNYYIFNTLVSQYFLLPKRRNFAVNELAALYKLSQKTNKPVYSYIGSFAGAMGWGQFLPSSVLEFYVDDDNVTANIDVYSVEDGIFSIENYLYKHKLDQNTMRNQQHIYNAIYAYNHSAAYVEAVQYIYRKLKEWNSEIIPSSNLTQQSLQHTGNYQLPIQK